MKKIILLLALAASISSQTMAQAPQKFNYQGIARNISGAPLASTPIGLRISVLDGSSSGPVVYQETQTATTNAYGLYNVAIGSGTVVSGTVAGINWATGDKYMKVEIDPTGGSSYVNLGTSQLLSVPYAMYAASGTPGPAGPSGPAGPAGPSGPAGPTGATGATGAAGATGATGATGAAGTSGNTVLSGSGAPSSSTGVNGDFYINTTTNTMFGPKASGAWPATGTSLVGPAGSASISGTTNYLVKFTASSTGGNSQIIDNGTTVGINASSPISSTRLDVRNNTGTSNSVIRATLGGSPSTSITTPSAIYGQSDSGLALVGVSSAQHGIYGRSTATSYSGVVGVASGSSGSGIYGLVTSTGVAGYFDAGTSGGTGVVVDNGPSYFGATPSTTGHRLAVIQPSTSLPKVDTNAALYAYSNTSQACLKGAVLGVYNGSNFGVGVQGLGYNGINNQDAGSSANFGFGSSNDYGVYGSANTSGVIGTSSSGIGVLGYNRSSTNAATTGVGNTYGVYGNATTIGTASTPSTRYGVYAAASGATTNYAGYFSGNVLITGSIAKGSGTFKIDHPLDPENKYLYHSFVESPDMMNIYNGNVTTDGAGFATVTLPNYFDALNKDFRYQLTVIGTFAQAIVKEKVSGNTFVIQTNQPNVEVSWQVTGVRKDKYAEAHRVVPEVEKEAEFKGRYLHPLEWNQPESKGIDELTRPKSTGTQR